MIYFSTAVETVKSTTLKFVYWLYFSETYKFMINLYLLYYVIMHGKNLHLGSDVGMNWQRIILIWFYFFR